MNGMKIMKDEVVCSFDIGGSKVVSARVGDGFCVTEVGREQTCATDFTGFCEQIRRMAMQVGGDAPVAISVAGVVHPSTGIVLSANIPAIHQRPLAQELSALIGRDVYVLNDASAFGLAEAVAGVGKNRETVFAAIIGTGIGGAVILNQRCLTGADGNAGEWGHGPASAMRTGCLLPRLSCGCGQVGCVDTLGGARGLERLHHHLCTDSASSKSILSKWHAGDPDAAYTVDVFVDIVGGALANMINFIGPDIVPLGGGLAGDTALVAALNTEVNNRRLGQNNTDLLIRAVDGPERGLIGAAIYAKEMRHGCNA